jgi:23S rRNA (cytosine1962-C5)-methyltransferase
METITLLKGKEVSLLRRHHWVFSGAMAKTTGKAANGDVVRVEAVNGRFLGVGHYHDGSIAVRILSFDDRAIDAAFWHERLSAALLLRNATGLPSAQTNCFRLVHGEGDGLPGLIIDIYGAAAVVQAHTTGMALAADVIASALQKVKGLKLDTIYLRDIAGKSARFIVGDMPEAVVLENGLQFKVNWVEGPEDGLLSRPARQPRPAGRSGEGPHGAQHVLLHGRVLGLCPQGGCRQGGERGCERQGRWAGR